MGMNMTMATPGKSQALGPHLLQEDGASSSFSSLLLLVLNIISSSMHMSVVPVCMSVYHMCA